MAEAGCTYGMPLQARVLQANTCERSKSQWLVGTTSLRNENEVRVLEYDAAIEAVRSVAAYPHAEELWDVAVCPAAEGRLLTVHSKVGTYGATLWRQDGGAALAPLAQLPHAGVVRRALWHQTLPELVVTVEEGALHKWQLGAASADVVATAPAEGSDGGDAALRGACLHPTRPGLAAVTAGGGALQLWDVQNMARVAETAGSQQQYLPARDVSWAPHNEHRLVTGGDDGKLRFWDARALKAGSLLELGGHSHWVWRAAYSPFHDQLVASASSDSTACLWYTPVLAKRRDAAIGGGASRASQSPAPAPRASAGAPLVRGEVDGRVHTYDEHEESVYGLAWSAADAWAFASLSYDGRVVVNKVPKNIKYKVQI